MYTEIYNIYKRLISRFEGEARQPDIRRLYIAYLTTIVVLFPALLKFIQIENAHVKERKCPREIKKPIEMQTNKLRKVNCSKFKKHTWLDCSKLNQSESCLRALTNRQRRCIYKLLELRLTLYYL